MHARTRTLGLCLLTSFPAPAMAQGVFACSWGPKAEDVRHFLGK
jgi:hypothetical protein